mgnify:CR=1 FL=1
MNKLILAKDKETAIELQKLGCKLLNEQDGIYTLVNCSEKMNFSDFDGRIVLTNRLKF